MGGWGRYYIAILAIVAACGFATTARAADSPGSPTAICADLQDGTLNGSYSQAELNAFLRDPTVQGYCSAIVPPCLAAGGSNDGSNGTSCRPSSAAQLTGVKGARKATAKTGTLPFTGAQLALFLVVGLALLATGLLLHTTSRPSNRR